MQLMRILLREGHRLTFAPRDTSEPEPYLSELQSLGVEVLELPSTSTGERGAGRRSRAALGEFLRTNEVDVAILYHHRTARRLIPCIRQASPRTMLAVDCVDVHFLRLARQAEVSGDPEDAALAARERRQELDTYRAADLVIAISDDEAHLLRPLVGEVPVTVIPNVHPQPEAVPGFHEREHLFFVGSFAHPPNVDALDVLTREVMPRVRERLGDVRLRVAGGGAALLPGTEGVELLGFVPELEPLIDTSRLLVAPLRFGAGAKGKVGQGLAHGLPVATTTVGAEGLGLTPMEDVLVADDPAELAALVIRAYTDQGLWEHLSTSGRRAVERFGPARVGEDLLRGVLNSPSLDRARARRRSLLSRVLGR